MSDISLRRVRTAHGQRRAILCVCGASALFVIVGALVKAVAPVVPIMEIVLFRSLVGTLVMLPLLRGHGGLASLRTSRPWGHAGRTAAGFVGMFGTYYGYAHLPLATVTALGFAMPLFLSLLSVPLLGERVGLTRAGAIVAGLVGVLVMVRPWQENASAFPMGPVMVVIAGVVAWALAMISIRRMGIFGERNVTIVLWYSLGSAVLSAMFTAPIWVMPDLPILAGLLGVGLISAMGQLLLTEGYRSGETTLVAPFEYGAIVYTTVIGLVIWGEVPDVWSLVGILILVCAGLVVWRGG